MTQALRSADLVSPSGPASERQGPVSSVRCQVPNRRLGPAPRIRYTLAIGPASLLGLWALCSWTGWLDARVLSKPWTVAATTRLLLADGRLQAHLLTSAEWAFLGLSLGISVGTLLALFSGLTRIGEVLMEGPVQIKRAIPTLALIPLLILWFGIGEPMKVLTIALSAMIPVYMHLHAGLCAIDTRYVELAETVRLTRWEFVRKVALPGALPGFLMGIRFAVTAAWLSLVVVEQINATSGIGYMMSLARSYGQTEIIIVGLVVYGLFGLVSDTVLRWLDATEAEALALDAELDRLIKPEYAKRQLAQTLRVKPEELELDAELPKNIPSEDEIEGAKSRFTLIVNLARRERLTVRQLIGRLGGGRGHRTFAGTPEQVADAIQQWWENGAADGFNIMPPVLPSGLAIFVEQVVLILQRRGLFRTEYEGKTLRENYGLARPGNANVARPALEGAA